MFWILLPPSRKSFKIFFSALCLFYLDELEKFFFLYKPSVIKWTKYLVFCCSSSQRLSLVRNWTSKESNWDWEIRSPRMGYIESCTSDSFTTCNVMVLKIY